MRNITIYVCLVILVLASILLSLKEYDTKGFLFRQFAFSSLLYGEECIHKGDYENGFLVYRTLVSRAMLSGEKNIANKIRNRMALIGKETLKKGNRDGWRFLEYYAVTSNDFENSAFLIEDWCLRNGLKGNTFEYNLLRKNDEYTYWESRFEGYSYLLRRIFMKFFDDQRRQILKNEIELFKCNFYLKKAQIRLNCPNGIRKSTLTVEGLGEDETFYYLGSRGYVKLEDNGHREKIAVIKELNKNFNMICLVIKHSHSFKRKNIRVYIKREYEVL